MQSIFGTDGIRGKFNEFITYDFAKKVGYALGKSLKKEAPIVIGRDPRESGYIILDAIKTGLNLANKSIIDVGICPTPAIPFLIKRCGCSSGIMISASHNPPEYNGIKIFDQNGKKLKKIYEKNLEQAIQQKIPLDASSNHIKENIKNPSLLQFYEDSLINSMGNENLDGIKIILDTCHGSATSCAEKIFKKFGANIKVINSKADGLKINVKCGSTCLDPIKKAVQANSADIGFSFDGDADRVIGIDSEGNILDGDHILFLWGRELMLEKRLKNNILITTSMANLGFENSWIELGGILHRTEVGDKFIYEEIINKKAYLGGEQSGHILSKINDFCGDGILTAIQISRYCKKKNITLKNWLKTSFSAFPQELTNIPLPCRVNSSILKSIDETIEKTLSNIAEPCRIFVRPSGTEPFLRVLVEAENTMLLKNCSIQITKKIEDLIKH